MKLWIKWLFHERKSWKKGRMTSTLSSLAQPTGLHCPGAGGWLSPSDLLELLTLITALCPHTVQMGPFVGLPWSSGVRGRGRAGGSRRGLPGGFTLSFKEGGETPKHRAEKQALFRKAEREHFYSQHCSAGFVAGIYYHLKLKGWWSSCMRDDTGPERGKGVGGMKTLKRISESNSKSRSHVTSWRMPVTTNVFPFVFKFVTKLSFKVI